MLLSLPLRCKIYSDSISSELLGVESDQLSFKTAVLSNSKQKGCSFLSYGHFLCVKRNGESIGIFSYPRLDLSCLTLKRGVN